MSPELSKEVAKLKLIPVVERCIEGKHSLITQRVQKHWRSGRVIRLTLRMLDLRGRMMRTCSYMTSLITVVNELRNPFSAARLGVVSHPDIVMAARNRDHPRAWTVLNRVLYRCDLGSKYEYLAAQHKFHENKTFMGVKCSGGVFQVGRRQDGGESSIDLR